MEIYSERYDRLKKYIFTNKNYSPKSIMSTILGIISAVSYLYAVYFTYQNQGVASSRFASAAFLITIFALVGLVLGIISKMEPDRFYLFSYIGIIMNLIVLTGISMVLYAGAYGI